MRVIEVKYSRSLGYYYMQCPLCDSILASGCDMDVMPAFAICECDRNADKQPVYEVFEKEGKTMIRRNKYPRFEGEVTMGQTSDIEHVEWEDNPDVMDAASAMRKAAEFLSKRHER